MRRLVQNRHVLSLHRLDDSQRGETRSASDVDNAHVRMAQIRRLESVVPHILRPVAGIDDMVVHDGQEPVEPVGLLLVLDEPRLRRWP